ncbi:putative expressed protein [Lyophyllum shimeji]|uniref:Expressed protein n=1 Tax=Lyophyllum shimeji TaxID=47721 RepID=A0A9P3UIS8_LYOSH|nr:putative expressed protein [Lyophyllum shimeji]
MLLLRSFPIVTLAFWLLPVTTGQATDATCLPFYAWANNSHKQSPCQVAAVLLAVCGPYKVAALPDGSHYTGPALGATNRCQCNTVVYSLMSACGSCQGRTYETWDTWSGNCPTVSISSFPEAIPPNTFVPGWAYFDVQTSGNFNATAARLSANSTVESTALPTPTSVSSISITTTTPAPTTSKEPPPATTSSAASTSAPSSAHDNALMGGIVGGTVGLAVVLGFIHWYFARRRRRTAERGAILSSPTVEAQTHGPPTADMQQYLANTLPAHLSSSPINTSLVSPSSAQFSNLSGPGSIGSEARSDT